MSAVRSHRWQLLLPAVVALTTATLALPAASAECSPEGTTLTLTAFDNKFDKDCMAVPPDQAFTLEFKNEDRGIPHNVSLYDKSSGTEKTLYQGEITDGGTVTYQISAQAKGNYIFRCDPHPEFMVGTFIVG